MYKPCLRSHLAPKASRKKITAIKKAMAMFQFENSNMIVVTVAMRPMMKQATPKISRNFAKGCSI